ncbi:MAG: hypothetical protein QXN96_00865 [Candidatus Bathyarchaeia archaeon]
MNRPEGVLIFVSLPNDCRGCPINEAGVPMGFKIAHQCGKFSYLFDVVYGLTDVGKTVCFVYERVLGSA